jgi:hypothetical protein
MDNNELGFYHSPYTQHLLQDEAQWNTQFHHWHEP